MSASRVAAALAVMPGGRNVTGVTSVPSRAGCRGRPPGRGSPTAPGSAPRPGPTWGIWIRWSISASPAKPGLVGGQGHRRAARPPGPRPRGTGTAGARPRARGRRCAGADAVPDRGVGRSARRSTGGAPAPDDHLDAVPALGVQRRADRRRRGVAARPGPAPAPGRSRRGVAAPALVAGRVEQDGDRRQPGCARPRRASAIRRVGVQAEGVDDGGQPAAEPGGDDAFEQVEGVGRGVEVVRAAADDAAQVVGGHDLRAAVARGGPGGLARPRRRRRGRRVRDRAGARSGFWQGRCVSRRRTGRARPGRRRQEWRGGTPVPRARRRRRPSSRPPGPGRPPCGRPARRPSRRSRHRSSGHPAHRPRGRVSTARSSSRQEISKSSRIEACDASRASAEREPSRRPRSPRRRRATRWFSVTTWRARRRRTGVVQLLDARRGRRPGGELDPERLGGVRALGPPVAVRRRRSGVADPGVDDQEHQPARRPAGAAPAWRCRRRSRAAARGPARPSIATVWSMPPVGRADVPRSRRGCRRRPSRRASPRRRGRGPAAPAIADRDRALEGGRARQPGAERHLAVDAHVEPGTAMPVSRSAHATPAT